MPSRFLRPATESASAPRRLFALFAAAVALTLAAAQAPPAAAEEITGVTPEDCEQLEGDYEGGVCSNVDPQNLQDFEEQQQQEEEQLEQEQQEEQEDSADSGPLVSIMVGALDKLFALFASGVDGWADEKAKDLSGQLVDGRYMIEPPNDNLVSIYRETAKWVKPGAIALLLLLGLSMILRSADYNTAYAAQYGIPKIVLVMAGIAFMPDLITLAANLTQSISQQIVDEQAVSDAYERLFTTNAALAPAFGLVILVKLTTIYFGFLILIAIAVRNLVFGFLFVIGPLAILFHAVPQLSEVAVSWLKGTLACFAISVVWALELGIGFRFIADPTLLYSGTGWRLLPILMQVGLLWLVWKTPWWIFGMAFTSYSPGGGSGGGILKSALFFATKIRGGGR